MYIKYVTLINHSIRHSIGLYYSRLNTKYECSANQLRLLSLYGRWLWATALLRRISRWLQSTRQNQSKTQQSLYERTTSGKFTAIITKHNFYLTCSVCEVKGICIYRLHICEPQWMKWKTTDLSTTKFSIIPYHIQMMTAWRSSKSLARMLQVFFIDWQNVVQLNPSVLLHHTCNLSAIQRMTDECNRVGQKLHLQFQILRVNTVLSISSLFRRPIDVRISMRTN